MVVGLWIRKLHLNKDFLYLLMGRVEAYNLVPNVKKRNMIEMSIVCMNIVFILLLPKEESEVTNPLDPKCILGAYHNSFAHF
jgi:hypothetical protein